MSGHDRATTDVRVLSRNKAPASRLDVGFAFGSLVASSCGPRAATELGRTVSDLGYSSFWVAETVGPEAFSLLSAVGAEAPSLQLGTGVSPLQVRPPTLMSMGGATLQSLHPDGMILLGIGVSSRVVVEQWHGKAFESESLELVREYVAIVRACLAGNQVSFDGRFYRVYGFKIGCPLKDKIPQIVLAAMNPGMLRLAGEIADGVLLNYVPVSHVSDCLAHVRAGERHAGRPSGACVVYGYVHVAVGDPSECADAARRDAFSYTLVDSYARSFTSAGFGMDVAAARELEAAGRRPDAVASLSDEFVRALNLVGDAAEVRKRVLEYAAAGVDVPVVLPMPFAGDPMAVVEATVVAASGC